MIWFTLRIRSGMTALSLAELTATSKSVTKIWINFMFEG